MKLTYKLTDRIEVEFDTFDQSEILKTLHKLAEILLEDTCGKCKSHDIVPQVRTKGKYTYHELKCRGCGAVLQFGQTDEGLYPRRKEMDGVQPKMVDGKPVWLPNHGWIKWDNEQQKYV